MKQGIRSVVWKIRQQKTPDQNRKKETRLNEDSLRDLRDNIRCSLRRVPEREEGSQGSRACLKKQRLKTALNW